MERSRGLPCGIPNFRAAKPPLGQHHRMHSAVAIVIRHVMAPKLGDDLLPKIPPTCQHFFSESIAAGCQHFHRCSFTCFTWTRCNQLVSL